MGSKLRWERGNFISSEEIWPQGVKGGVEQFSRRQPTGALWYSSTDFTKFMYGFINVSSFIQVPPPQTTILINGVNSTSGSNTPGIIVEDLGLNYNVIVKFVKLHIDMIVSMIIHDEVYTSILVILILL